MSALAKTTNVYAFFHNNGGWNSTGSRIWVKGVENKRNSRGELVLVPQLDDEAEKARPFPYETFAILRRRFASEGLPEQYRDLRATLAPGDGEEIDTGVSQNAPDINGRTIQIIDGIVVRPGYDVTGAAWFIKVFGEGGLQLDSIRADSPEAAIVKLKERGMQAKAERAPQAAPTEEEVSAEPVARIRPGALKKF